MRVVGILISLCALLFSCGKEDCSLAADQAITAFEIYQTDTTEVLCIEAKEALQFYFDNCENDNVTLEDALGSLPCD